SSLGACAASPTSTRSVMNRLEIHQRGAYVPRHPTSARWRRCMQVYLIRHAQSEDNAQGLRKRMSRSDFNALLTRASSAALTPLGTMQAQQLAQRLADVGIAHVHTSPHVRALATATIVGRALDLTPTVHPELGELMPPPLLTPKSGQASLRWLFVRAYLRM